MREPTKDINISSTQLLSSIFSRLNEGLAGLLLLEDSDNLWKNVYNSFMELIDDIEVNIINTNLYETLHSDESNWDSKSHAYELIIKKTVEIIINSPFVKTIPAFNKKQDLQKLKGTIIDDLASSIIDLIISIEAINNGSSFDEIVEKLLTANSKASKFSENSVDIIINVNPLTEFAAKAQAVRHKENRQIKNEAISWYLKEGHKLGSKDEAAFIATKLFVMKFSTIRKYFKNL